MSKRMMDRHTKAGIYIHWFNALAWFFLMATGLGLIDNPELSPLGPGYSNGLRAVFGGGANLLYAHIAVGLLWALIWLLFILIGVTKFTVPFVRRILTYSPGRDFRWMVKKNLQMVMGYKFMAKAVEPLGWDGRIPDQGYYNAGQKLAAVGFVLGGLALLGTGVIMAVSKYYLEPHQVALVQWSITIHYIAAGVTFGLLLLHIYMAAISPEERPAFFSMFTGKVPEEYARHHHKDWYKRVAGGRANQT